jgi:GT2 family glycosyltransferase
MVKASYAAGMTVPPFEHTTQAFDVSRRPVGEIAQSAFADLAVAAVALAQKDGGRRVPVRDRFDIRAANGSRSGRGVQLTSALLHGYVSRHYRAVSRRLPPIFTGDKSEAQPRSLPNTLLVVKWSCASIVCPVAENGRSVEVASVDVIIPSYQYGRYLGDAISSVLCQGIAELRVLIIDNASTDDSVQIAHDFAARSNNVEVREHSTNLGYHASVNEGLDWAAGDYLVVLCADDLLPQGALVRAVSALEDNPRTAFAYGAFVHMTGFKQIPLPPTVSDAAAWRIQSGQQFVESCSRKMVHSIAPLIRTRIQKKVGHFRPALRYTSDFEMLLRLACFGDVAATRAVQGVQRLHDSNVSMSFWKDPMLAIANDLITFDSFFEHEGKSLPCAASIRGRARRSAGEQAYWKGLACIVRGERRAGIDLLRLAVRLAPRTMFVPPLGRLANIDRPIQRASHLLGSLLVPGAAKTRDMA